MRSATPHSYIEALWPKGRSISYETSFNSRTVRPSRFGDVRPQLPCGRLVHGQELSRDEELGTIEISRRDQERVPGGGRIKVGEREDENFCAN